MTFSAVVHDAMIYPSFRRLCRPENRGYLQAGSLSNSAPPAVRY